MAQLQINRHMDKKRDLEDLLWLAGDGVGNGAKDVGRLDEFLQNVALGGQWEAVIQHLVQQLNIVHNGTHSS